MLFADNTNRKWFACSVYRSAKDCKFKVDILEDGTVNKYKHNKIVSVPLEEYGKIAKK